MKYRGVKIVVGRISVGVDIGKTKGASVKDIWEKCYRPFDEKGYPCSTLEEAKEAVDWVISQTMEKCGVGEREAVRLLKE